MIIRQKLLDVMLFKRLYSLTKDIGGHANLDRDVLAIDGLSTIIIKERSMAQSIWLDGQQRRRFNHILQDFIEMQRQWKSVLLCSFKSRS